MRPGHNSSSGSEEWFESTIDLRLSLMTVEQSQLVDKHHPKSEAGGVLTLPFVGTCSCASKMLLKCSLKFSLALLYAACERFASPPPLSRCGGRCHVWR